MRRLLIPIFAVMLIGPAMATVTDTATINVFCEVEGYVAVDAYPASMTLDPNPSPGVTGYASTWLGVHCNSAATLTVTGTGIFVNPAWPVKTMQTLHWDGFSWVDVTAVPDGVPAHTDDDPVDALWKLDVSARPDYSVPTGGIEPSQVSVLISP